MALNGMWAFSLNILIFSIYISLNLIPNLIRLNGLQDEPTKNNIFKFTINSLNEY